ncbi:MAG: aminopeptidase P family protein [Deltaproteobacteria bacterium]|nr:aminopeptidase P family protein [Deltaproteobacteria bacterium]MBW1913505.1 aminopeptidase P family protein [Deltaproteobacteria bacterium]
MNIFNTNFDYQSRLNKIRKLMDEREIDVMLVHFWPNQYYISGMFQPLPWYPVENNKHTEMPLIIFRDRMEDPIFLITWLTGNGLKEGTWIKDVRLVDKEPFGKYSWQEYLAEILKEKRVNSGTIGIEEHVCTISTFNKLKSAAPKARFQGIDDIFQIARMIKEPEEIELIKESVLIAEASLKAGMETSGVGVLESEINFAAETEAKRRGAIREVETMCQSGIRTSHHRAMASNWKRVDKNDLVMIDIGLVYKGYGSDLTRTWVEGKPTDKQKKITDDLVRAHGKVLDNIRPGVKIWDVLDSGDNELKKEGYITGAPLPSNSIGVGHVGIHGIGLGPMHDPPHVMEHRETKLEVGMTLAVSGTARFEDFTIRFEDDVVVVQGGYELINKLIPWEL